MGRTRGARHRAAGERPHGSGMGPRHSTTTGQLRRQERCQRAVTMATATTPNTTTRRPRGCGCQHDDARRPPHLCGVESQGEGAH